MFNKIFDFFVTEKKNKRNCITVMGKRREYKNPPYLVIKKEVDNNSVLSKYFIGVKSLRGDDSSFESNLSRSRLAR